MAEAANVLNFNRPTPTLELVPPLQALPAAELPVDVFSRHQAARLIGSVSVGHEVQRDSEGLVTSLHDAIHKAVHGDKVALAMVGENSAYTAREIVLKAGEVTEITVDVNGQGTILQHGQPLEVVHANALKFASAIPQIRARSEPETRNGFRLKNLREAYLDDYYFVVFSAIPDDISEETAKELHFFTDTQTCVIQATTNTETGMVMESAFVAGVTEPGKQKHDLQAISYTATRLGVDTEDRTATQWLDAPLLVPKALMPNGVVDIVKLYDEYMGTFFGQDQPVQDYVAYREVCRKRQTSFKPKVKEIVRDLLAEANTITSPIQAIERLHKIAEGHMVEQAVEDRSIDPQVFGPVAAGKIESARIHAAEGNNLLAQADMKAAKRTARSSTCPSAIEKAKLDTENEDSGMDSQEKSSDSKDGTVNCIKCRKTVSKAQVVKEKSWRCPSCSYEIDICSGKELHRSQASKHESTTILGFAKRKLKQKKIHVPAAQLALTA